MTYDPRRENLFDQCKTLVQLNAGTPLPTRDDRDDIVRELCEALEPLAAAARVINGPDDLLCYVLLHHCRRAEAAVRRARGQQ